jgi:hypothetical protein
MRRVKAKRSTKILGTTAEDSWNKAMLRAKGMKVKDDVKLIEKTRKRKLVLKRKSAKVWDERKKQLEEKQQKRQKKREFNLNKRKEQNKATKVKRRAKR